MGNERCISRGDDIIMNTKPPIGIMPKYIWESQRLDELRQAIFRFLDDGRSISIEWINEYNELIDKATQ